MICTGAVGENTGFVLAGSGDLLNQDLAAGFLSNHLSGMYLFIRWQSVFDLLNLAIVNVIAMKSTVLKAEDTKFTLNQ